MKAKHPIALSIVLLALVLGGCASPAQSTAMVAKPFAKIMGSAASVSTNVSGGSDTTLVGASQISNESFKTALDTSILESGLFAAIASGAESGNYHLEVTIVRVDQPILGFSMTVTLETNWILSRVGDKEVLWRKAIVSSHTVSTGEAFVGVTRLRLANEGAARKNFENAIAQMAALGLK